MIVSSFDSKGFLFQMMTTYSSRLLVLRDLLVQATYVEFKRGSEGNEILFLVADYDGEQIEHNLALHRKLM